MADIEVLDLETAKSLLRQAIEEKGESYVYPGTPFGDGCVYVNADHSPSCLVGHALILGGIKSSTIVDLEINYHTAPAALYHLQSFGHIDRVTLEAEGLFGLVQKSQDSGATWGDAYANALEGKWWTGSQWT